MYGTGLGFLFSIIETFFLLFLIIIIILVVAAYKFFEKCGVPGWKALIPIYNTYVLTVEIAKLNVAWFALTFAGFIPIIGWIAVMVAFFNIFYTIAGHFTDDKITQVIAGVIPGIFIFIFAFDNNYKFDGKSNGEHGIFNETFATGGSRSSSGSFCKNCGHKVNKGEKFCENCGSKL